MIRSSLNLAVTAEACPRFSFLISGCRESKVPSPQLQVIMLTAHHISKTYVIQPILEDISFSISNVERVGLIGPNGSGKTTLMRILAGFEQPDAGAIVSTRPNLRVGYLAQGMDFDPEQTIQSTLSLQADSEGALEIEIASLASELAIDPDDPHIQARYDSALHQISNLQSLPAILAPLGLSDLPLNTPVKHLSGGQKNTPDAGTRPARRTSPPPARRADQPPRY